MNSGTLWLRQDLAALWKDQDPFKVVLGLRGEAVREVAERSTIRVALVGRVFYIKRHYGVGWREIFKNWLTLKRPVLDAGNEYRAAQALKAAGLDSLEVAGFGMRGRNPARRQSFLITDELKPVQNLEQLCLRWPEAPPQPALKHALIRRVARIARTMHGLGFTHQDFYLCHLLLDTRGTLTAGSAATVPIHVVDLHRAVQHARIPVRGLVKDLGGLYYSTLEIGLSRRDVFRFLKVYFDSPLRDILEAESGFLARCEHRARRLYAKARRKRILPRQLAGID